MEKIIINIVTYNHEQFIEKCIVSVLNQKIDYKYKINIVDDCSDDQTYQIILKYVKKYPKIIFAQQNSINKGMVKNITDSLSACDSEYVSILEGDDFFIDDQKINKQVAFLENNLDFSFCSTNGTVYYEEEYKKTHTYYNNSKLPPKEYDLKGFLEGNLNILNTSKVYRNTSFPMIFPKWYFKVHLWDWILHILQLKEGKGAFLDINGTGFYRHENSYTIKLNSLKNYLNGIETVRKLDKYLDNEYHYLFKNESMLWSKISVCYFKEKNYYKWFSSTVKSIFNDPVSFIKNIRDYFWLLRN